MVTSPRRRRMPAAAIALALLCSMLLPQAAVAQTGDELYLWPGGELEVGYEAPTTLNVYAFDDSEFGVDPSVRLLADGEEVEGAIGAVTSPFPAGLAVELLVSLPVGIYQLEVTDDGRTRTAQLVVHLPRLFGMVDPSEVLDTEVTGTTFTVTALGAGWDAVAPVVRVTDSRGVEVPVGTVMPVDTDTLTFTLASDSRVGLHRVSVVVGDVEVLAGFMVVPGPSICSGAEPLPVANTGLTNVGFEAGLTGWSRGTVVDSVEVVGTDTFAGLGGGASTPTTVTPFEGDSMLRLGSAYDTDQLRQEPGPNEVCQDFVVTSTTERFVFNAFTYDYTGFDEFRYDVTVQDSEGEIIARYDQGAFSEGTALKTTGWRGVELDLTGRVGETLRLTISAGGTLDSLYGFWAYIDSAVDVEFPDPVPITPIVGGNGSAMFDPNTGQTTIAFPFGTTDFGDLSITYPVGCAGDGEVEGVTVLLDAEAFPATVNEAGTAASVTIPASAVATAAAAGATITIQIDCPDGRQIVTLGRIVLYDPSGILTDADTGEFVEGAEVFLYRVPGWSPKESPDDDRPDTCQSHLSKAAEDPWDQPAPTFLGVLEPAASERISPNVNPFVSNAVGYYGWDVAEGCWYVRVVAEGYAPLTSPVVGVPPEVTDLDLVLTPIEISAPTWPDGAALAADPSATSVELSWPAASGVADPISYEVRRGDALVTTTGGTSATVSGLDELTGYTFSVTPVDANGTPGAPLEVTTTTLDGTPPDWGDTTLSATPGTTTVQLSWAPGATDPSTPVTYTVRRGDVVIATTEATSYEVTGLEELTGYAFSVTASDAVGNTSTARTVTTTTLDGTPPAWPNGAALTADASFRSVALSWPAATDPSTPITYTVRRGDVVVGTTTGTSFEVTGLAEGTSATFSVTASDAVGNVGSALEVTTATLVDSLPPAWPAGASLSGTTTPATVVLSWPAALDVSGPIVYTVRRGDVVIGTTQATTFTATGLEPGTTYAFSVTATDSAATPNTGAALSASFTTRAAGPTVRPPTCDEAATVPPFRDVPPTFAHADAIACAAGLGIVLGRDGAFLPNQTLNRGQLASILLRSLEASGIELTARASGFRDIEGSTHADAIRRLAAADIVRGRSATQFDPLGPVTRGQLMTMLDRASTELMAPYPQVAGPRFTDTRGSVHADAIDRMNAGGIANGYGGGRFGPNDTVLRGQAASFVTRWLEDQAERIG
jgi:chitodextrinase